jgi:hypothetical protein
MLAALGGIVMMLGMYAFLALQTSLNLAGVLVAVGILLVISQFFRIGRSGEPAAVIKGEASGR